ncbi:MAG: hypothetical protein H6974_09450 [Gammaproteobacteria bacterium]|nr:hypothetical protein [Gammaproteobacteria bacterium]
MTALTLTPINGEPRIRDLDLAERLGFERSAKIRDMIRRNEKKLLNFGILPTVGKIHEGAGRPTAEFYLNQKQAIFICMKSETDRAFDVQVEIVRVFDAYLNGHGTTNPDPQPGLSTRQYQALQDDAHEIGQSCHFGGSAKEAVYERIRFQYGLRSIRELRPEQFEAIQADLEGLKVLARQHFERMVTLDQEFIAAVLRPPVSIRKIRAMARKQEKQPPLQY